MFWFPFTFLIYVCKCVFRYESVFFFHIDNQLSKHHLLTNPFFLRWCVKHLKLCIDSFLGSIYSFLGSIYSVPLVCLSKPTFHFIYRSFLSLVIYLVNQPLNLSFLKTDLVILGLLLFHLNFTIIFSDSTKKFCGDFGWNYIEFIDEIWELVSSSLKQTKWKCVVKNLAGNILKSEWSFFYMLKKKARSYFFHKQEVILKM